MDTNNENILEDENISVPNADSTVDETEGEQNTKGETEGSIDETIYETIEDAEIVEGEELKDEESEELLESGKEKDMRKNRKKLEEENKKSQEENKKLQDEVDSFKDKLLRTTAEYENFRKRTVKEKQGIYTEACADVLKEVLPVLDNLERALSVDGCGEELRTGVEMTVRLFNDAFEKLGVEELASIGEFDPNLHNAVMHIEDEQYGVNEIVEVFQKGYKKENKVLRHSMVKVAN